MAAPQTVEDGYNDIVITEAGEKMRVEVNGRRIRGNAYLTAAKSDRNYKVEDDGPDKAGLPPATPGPKELINSDAVQKYLEVGIVIGDDPAKYTPSGVPRDKTRADGRDERGVHRRDQSALRAYTMFQSRIPAQLELFVACKPANGICCAKSIRFDSIFFYKEFLGSTTDSMAVKNRASVITQEIKHACAETKTTSTAPKAKIKATNADISNWTASDSLTVAPIDDLISKLVMQYELQTESIEQGKTRSYISGMRQTLEKAAPDLLFGPSTPGTGIHAFLDLEESIKDDEAEKLIAELKLEMGKDMVKLIHGTLRDNEDLGKRLEYQHLGFFLDMCGTLIQGTDWNVQTVKPFILKAFDAVRTHAKYHYYTRQKVADSSEGDPQVNLDQVGRLMDCARDGLIKTADRMDNEPQALVDEHGGLVKHSSVESTMASLAKAVDIDTAQFHWHQLASLLATQLGLARSEPIKTLRELAELLRQAIVLIREKKRD